MRSDERGDGAKVEEGDVRAVVDLIEKCFVIIYDFLKILRELGSRKRFLVCFCGRGLWLLAGLARTAAAAAAGHDG